jgi:hypothetical protein
MRLAIACICLFTLTTHFICAAGEGAADDAQATAHVTGAGLTAAAEKAHAALVSGDFETVWKCLGADEQAEVTEQREQMGQRLKWMEIDDPDLVAAFLYGFEQLDPQNKLGLAAPADLLKLTDTQFLGLACGLLAIGDHLSKAPTDVWFMTDQYSGLFPSTEWPTASTWRSGVKFESVDRWRLNLQFTARGEDWKLVDFELSYEMFQIEFANFLRNGAEYDVPLEALLPPWQQLLLRLSLRARSERVETGEVPSTLKECGVRTKKLSAAGYVVRDQVYSSEVEGALAAAPENEDEPWVMFVFSWVSGKGEFKEFTTEAQLDAELARRYPD